MWQCTVCSLIIFSLVLLVPHRPTASCGCGCRRDERTRGCCRYDSSECDICEYCNECCDDCSNDCSNGCSNGNNTTCVCNCPVCNATTAGGTGNGSSNNTNNTDPSCGVCAQYCDFTTDMLTGTDVVQTQLIENLLVTVPKLFFGIGLQYGIIPFFNILDTILNGTGGSFPEYDYSEFKSQYVNVFEECTKCLGCALSGVLLAFLNGTARGVTPFAQSILNALDLQTNKTNANVLNLFGLV